MIAHYRYRNSPQFMANGFRMPAYRVLNPLTTAFFVFIYCTLFIGADTRGPAIAGLVWLRDLKQSIDSAGDAHA